MGENREGGRLEGEMRRIVRHRHGRAPPHTTTEGIHGSQAKGRTGGGESGFGGGLARGGQMEALGGAGHAAKAATETHPPVGPRVRGDAKSNLCVKGSIWGHLVGSGLRANIQWHRGVGDVAGGDLSKSLTRIRTRKCGATVAGMQTEGRGCGG